GSESREDHLPRAQLVHYTERAMLSHAPAQAANGRIRSEGPPNWRDGCSSGALLVPIFRQRDRPDPLEGQLRAQVGAELVVVHEHLIDQVALVPQPHPEELVRDLTLHALLEPAPGHEQTVRRPDVLHRSDELVERRSIQRVVAALDLHADAGLTE